MFGACNSDLSTLTQLSRVRTVESSKSRLDIVNDMISTFVNNILLYFLSVMSDIISHPQISMNVLLGGRDVLQSASTRLVATTVVVNQDSDYTTITSLVSVRLIHI